MSTTSVAALAGAKSSARVRDWGRLERRLCGGAIGFGVLVRFYRCWEPSLSAAPSWLKRPARTP